MNFEKVTACHKLYFKFSGTEHKLIARVMRANGWTDFSRRVFYRRGNRPGWPELYGWDLELRDDETAGHSDTGKRRRKGRPGSGFANRRDRESTHPGNAGTLACIDAKASGELDEETNQTEPRTVGDQAVIANNDARHAGGTGVAGKGACGPGDVSAGNAGTPACIDAKASGERVVETTLSEPRTSSDPAEVVNNNAPHAGGTGVAGEGACGPGDAASPRPGVSPSLCLAFHAWLKTLPGIWTWDWRHQLYLYEKLQKVTDGECKRLMVFMPPRHGKSELVTVRYTAWRMLRDPSMNVILAGYNQKLANRFSRKIRRVLCDVTSGGSEFQVPSSELKTNSNTQQGAVNTKPRFQNPELGTRNSQLSVPMFPFTKQRCANSVAEWETAIGGGLRAVGVGGGVTGYGAQLIMIDDPVKNRAQAESATFRDGVWNWYNDDLYTRLEPGGSIILIQTRWHEDDLAGRLLREMKNGGEQWEIVDLPALAETGSAGIPARPCESEEPTAVQDQVAVPADLQQSEDWRAGSPRSNLTGNAGIPACIDAKASDERGEETTQSEPRTSAGPAGVVNNDAPHAGGTGVAGKGACVPGEGVAGKGACVPGKGGPGGGDPLNREPGEALCRERYDETALARIKTQLGTYSFSALYQQHPVPAEGATFKRAWFRNIIDAAPPGLRWFRDYDLAVSTKTSADYTASFRIAQDKDGNVYIADGFRARVEFPEQRKYIIERITTERNTSHGIEAAIHGQALVQELRRDRRLSGSPFKAVRVDTDKLTRALSWANTAEEGKIFLVNGAWIQDFLEEVLTFPSGKHDDQIDAVSIAIRMIAEVGTNKGWGIQRL